MPDVSDDAVRRATGHGRDHWFRALDGSGAADHPARALHLERLGVPPWWCQMVTVEYEKARGLRVPGQTSTGDFQASAQRSLPLDAEAAWDALLSAPWLGPGLRPRWEEGATFAGPEGERVEVRAVRPGRQLRLWRHLPSGKTTVEVALQAGVRGTAVRISETGIPTAAENEAAKQRWRAALATLPGASAGAPAKKARKQAAAKQARTAGPQGAKRARRRA